MKLSLKKILLLSLLILFSLNFTGCFSISSRSKMKDEHIKTYPGVAAYNDYVTKPFEKLDTSESIFFGVLISPHLVGATMDLPFSFIVDSVMHSSDQRKLDEWEAKPEEFFKSGWSQLVANIQKTNLEDALFLIDDVGFKKFWKLLQNKPEEEKILFALLKFIDQAKKPSAEKYALNELKKFSSEAIIKVMRNSWWPHSIVPENNQGGGRVRSAYLKGKKASFAIEVNKITHKSFWRFDYYPEVIYIFEMPDEESSSFVTAVKRISHETYDIRILSGKPANLKLPKVSISNEELMNWTYGWGISRWAEKYIPTEIIEHFQFEENKFGVPEVILE